MQMPCRSEAKDITLKVKEPSGEYWSCTIPDDTPINEIAVALFEEKGWPTTDTRGRGQRAVAELADPDNPSRRKRLRSEQTVREAGLTDGDELYVFPESIAGAVDERERVRALVTDHQDMKALAEWNPRIRFETNMSHAPTRYTVTFDCPGFSSLSDDGVTPKIAERHRVEIVLEADYPRSAPGVRWLTPVFHPNVRPADGQVCLGVLMERYQPGLGLARLVTMLAEMAQYRNFDMTSALNGDAARWAANPDNIKHITGIGGSPFQGPVQEILKTLRPQEGEPRRRIRFTPAGAGRGGKP